MKKLIILTFLNIFTLIGTELYEKTSSEERYPINILCLDGGGVRGIIPAVFLEELDLKS